MNGLPPPTPAWNRVDALFARACLLEGAAREALLRRAERHEPDVVAEVRSLLRNDERSGGFLETPAFAPSSHPDVPAVGQHLGPYRIVRLCGQGGMGTVFEAVRERPRRRVALKILNQAGFPSESRCARFEREAESLARLAHPGIATLYDAGRVGGVPYIAMEFVEGPTLSAWVRERRPDRAERLAVFLDLCTAVSAAHDCGIIHRDLKPENIIVVTRDGRPSVKVLDFGLARVVASDPDPTPALTASGTVVGTLAYASPEQATGRLADAGPPSDVYALGVLLHELLCDRLPYEVDGLPLYESIRVICEDSPRRPSSIDRTLRGDLETIVLKCIGKAPGDRYPDGRALAREIERFLDGRPIRARAPSTVYRLRKMVARHRLGFSLAAGAFLLVTSAAIAMSVLYLDALRAEERLAEEARTTREVNDFLKRILALADPAHAGIPDLTMRQLLDHTAERIDDELSRNTRLAAEVRTTVGQAYAGLGVYDHAEVQLRRALASRRAAVEAGSPALVEGLVALARVLMITGEATEARLLLEEAVEHSRAGGPSERLASSLMHLGAATRLEGEDPGRFATAGACFTEALDTLDALGAPRPVLRAQVLEERAGLIASQGHLEEAVTAYEEALATYRRPTGEPGMDVAFCLNDLAVTLGRQGRGEAAAAHYEDALEVLERILGPRHPRLAPVLDNLGDQLARNGRADRGEPLLRRALELRRRHLPAGHPDVAVTLNHLGQTLRHLGRPDEARASFEEALAVNRAHYGDNGTEVASGEANLAALALDAGAAAEAEAHARRALEVYDVSLPPDHWYRGACHDLLGRALLAQGLFDEAETELDRALSIVEATRGPHDGQTRAVLASLLRLYAATGREDEARRVRARL